VTTEFFQKLQSNLSPFKALLLALLFFAYTGPLAADQCTGAKSVDWTALEKTQKQQERELKSMCKRWKNESARLKKDIAQIPMPKTFEEAWEQIHQDIEIDRVSEALKIMEIELRIARDFIKGRNCIGQFLAEQNRSLLTDLRNRIDKQATQKTNAPSR